MSIIRYSFTGAKTRVQRPFLWRNCGSCLTTFSQRNKPIIAQYSNYINYFSSANPGSNNLETSPKESVHLTQAQKLRKAVTEYGTTVIVFHVGISLISLGSCYLMVSSGLDVEQLILNLKLDSWLKGNTMLVSNAGTFTVAYAIHKVFAPVRITITLGSVPLIVTFLRHKGILKK